MQKFNWFYILAMVIVWQWQTPEVTNADIVDFDDWTEIQDPAHPNLVAERNSSAQVTLKALGGPIPAGHDIGFASINGFDVATASDGWYFQHDQDFSIAIDYDLSFVGADGGFSIGFGIGEDIAGMDSAGIVLATQDGGLVSYAAGSRVGDTDNGTTLLGLTPENAARFLVQYEAATGTIGLGVSLDGDDVAEELVELDGLQDLWDDQGLLVSFFARSDNSLFSWQDGTAEAVFSDFRVISGAVTAVPEPGSAWALALVSLGLLARRRR